MNLITQSVTKWCLYHLDALAVMSPRMLLVQVMYSGGVYHLHGKSGWNGILVMVQDFPG